MAERRYNTNVWLRAIEKGDLHCNWEGPYMILQKLSHGAYKLESLEVKVVTRTWNTTSLRHYFN